MRKSGAFALMISALLLSGCFGGGAERDAVQLLQEEYRALAECDMTASLLCQEAEEVAEYELQCHWRSDGTAEVEILQPEELSGICAEFNGAEMTLVYEDISLAAGTVGDTELSAAQVLPLVIEAVREGYVLEKGTEDAEGQTLLRLLFDTTLGGGKVQYAVWFGSGHEIARAEVIRDGAVAFEMTFSEFSAGNAPEENDVQAE